MQDLGVLINDSVVQGNYAMNEGGGLYLATSNCNTCTFSISGTTNITENECLAEGGAMRWIGYKPSIDATVIISKNIASYGGDFASLPCSLMPQYRRTLGESDYLTIFDAAPGQVCTTILNISLYDTYGYVITTDNNSTISISTLSSYPDLSLRGNTTFTTTKGVFSLSSFIPGGPPGSTQRFIASTDAISPIAIPNDNSTYNNSVEIQIFLRNCTYGEQINAAACLPCNKDTFLIQPDYKCLACPNGGICLGGAHILPSPGYWRSSYFSAILYRCPISEACLGNSTESDYLGTCREGYEGIMCSSCIGGYIKSLNGNCSVCPSQSSRILLILVLVGVIIIFCMVLIKTTIRSAFSSKELYSIYIKIFTNYVQLTFLTSTLNFPWPSYLQSFFIFHEELVTSAGSLFSVDCYLSPTAKDTPEDKYYYKLALISLVPMIILGISLLIWLGMAFTKETWIYLKRELWLTFIILFFLVYPNITIFEFNHFACENIDLMGSYLRSNYDIECSGERYNFYSLAIAIPSIFTWILALPTIVLIIMTKKQRFLNRENNRVIFGFLYNGYRKVRFYWEFIIMYRKVMIISISVFFMNFSLSIQALTILLVMTVISVLHYKLNPYSSDHLNHMEMEALVTSLLTIYCGLYYLIGDIDSVFQFTLFITILMGNAYFVLYWLYWICLALLDSLAPYYPLLRYYFKKGDAYDIEFYQDPIARLGSYFEQSEGVRLYTFKKPTQNQAFSEKYNKFNKLASDSMVELYKKVAEQDYSEIIGKQNKKSYISISTNMKTINEDIEEYEENPHSSDSFTASRKSMEGKEHIIISSLDEIEESKDYQDFVDDADCGENNNEEHDYPSNYDLIRNKEIIRAAVAREMEKNNLNSKSNEADELYSEFLEDANEKSLDFEDDYF